MRPKDIGTRAESAVVRYLTAHGFPHAERRALHGAKDLGDITGTPGIVWEVKGGDAAKDPSDAQIDKWLEQTETERDNAGAGRGVLICQRRGKADAGQWWAWEYEDYGTGMLPVRMRLDHFIALIRLEGWGDE